VTSTPAINKWDVAASFSRAATTYDAVAELQRHAGERLLSLTPANDYADILDLGCGTGYFSRRLLARFPAKVTGIDIATGMLTVANLRRPAANILWCAGDAEALPLMPATQALIYSNLTVQWCQLSSCLKEAWRVLQPGGCFAFTTLGPDTLQELRGAWRKVDRHIHVNRFVSATTIRSAAAHHGFQCALETEERRVMRYQSVRQLTSELKLLGAHNINPGRPVGLMGKGKLRAMLQAYEAYRDQQRQLPHRLAGLRLWRHEHLYNRRPGRPTLQRAGRDHADPRAHIKPPKWGRETAVGATERNENAGLGAL